MKKTIMTVALTLACCVIGFAQSATTSAAGQASNETSAAGSQAAKSINIQSGTRLAAELQNTIDARKARVGDKVVLKTTKAIKSEGQTVVGKGTRLVGHVTDVEKKSDANGGSRIGILFDRLEKDSLAVPITATIDSITRGSSSARTNNDLFATDAGGSMSTSSSAQRQPASGGGRVLGGVSSTVGGVVNTTTSTTGQVVGATTGAVGSTVSTTTSAAGETTADIGRSLGRIQIAESTSASAEGSSMLSLQGENLRLEKGTTFHLTLNQSSNVKTTKDQ